MIMIKIKIIKAYFYIDLKKLKNEYFYLQIKNECF